MTTIAVWFFLCLTLALEPQYVATVPATSAAGGGGPAFVIANTTVAAASAGTYTLTLNTTGVTTLAVGVQYSSGVSCNATIVSVLGGASGVDTFTKIAGGTGTNASQTYECATLYSATGIHTSSSYNVVVTMTTGSSHAGIGALGFTGVTALDGSQICTGFANGSSPASCSAALTPSGSDACVAAAGGYYTADVYTAGTGYTIPTNGQANLGSNGYQIIMTYALCSSSSTPSVAVTGTKYTVIAGAALH